MEGWTNAGALIGASLRQVTLNEQDELIESERRSQDESSESLGLPKVSIGAARGSSTRGYDHAHIQAGTGLQNAWESRTGEFQQGPDGAIIGLSDRV